jgi:hypothetical protein
MREENANLMNTILAERSQKLYAEQQVKLKLHNKVRQNQDAKVTENMENSLTDLKLKKEISLRQVLDEKP